MPRIYWNVKNIVWNYFLSNGEEFIIWAVLKIRPLRKSLKNWTCLGVRLKIICLLVGKRCVPIWSNASDNYSNAIFLSKVVVDKYTALEPLYPWKPASPMRVPKTKYVYAGEHINHKAVIKDPKIFTTDSTDMYIPVEYYGQINPKVSK